MRTKKTQTRMVAEAMNVCAKLILTNAKKTSANPGRFSPFENARTENRKMIKARMAKEVSNFFKVVSLFRSVLGFDE